MQLIKYKKIENVPTNFYFSIGVKKYLIEFQSLCGDLCLYSQHLSRKRQENFHEFQGSLDGIIQLASKMAEIEKSTPVLDISGVRFDWCSILVCSLNNSLSAAISDGWTHSVLCHSGLSPSPFGRRCLGSTAGFTLARLQLYH